jgi:hypothetical protein
VITKIDSISVSGSFTGKVKDSSGVSKTISDGKFSARLKNTTVPPPPVGNGQLTFWAKSSCGAGGNITVKLSNNQTGAISTFTASAPACGATGTASFTLPPGNYTWKANCGSTDSTSGFVTIVANQCIKQECIFSAPTNCHISDMAFYDFTTNTAFGTIRSVYDASNKVSHVMIIDSINMSIDKDFAITYPTGRVQVDASQYFLLDGSGRVSEFHGYADPTDNTSGAIIMKYTYDGAGYMATYSMEWVDTPAITKWKGVLTWTNGNLTKLVENDPSRPTTLRYETTYEFNAAAVKNFIYTIPLGEITYFQTAINAGKNNANALVKETLKAVDPTSGNSATVYVTNYDNYIIDPSPNSYVRSFKAQDVGDPSSTKIVFQYKCF